MLLHVRVGLFLVECQALRPSISSSHSLFFRVLLENQEFQASQELMALQ